MVGYAMEAGLLTHRGRSGGSDTTQSVAWRYYQYDLHQTKQRDTAFHLLVRMRRAEGALGLERPS